MTTTNKKAPTLQVITDSIIKWQAETFPAADVYGASEHLRREAVEVWNHFWSPSMIEGVAKIPGPHDAEEIGEELADVYFLLVQTATKAGVDLREAVAKKYRKNLGREWLPPDEHGVVEHVKA